MKSKEEGNTVQPPVSDHPKMQRLGGHLREVVAHASRTTMKGEIFRQPRTVEWYIYFKKIVKVSLSLLATGTFKDKTISYSMSQFIYGRAKNKMSLKLLMNKNF